MRESLSILTDYLPPQHRLGLWAGFQRKLCCLENSQLPGQYCRYGREREERGVGGTRGERGKRGCKERGEGGGRMEYKKCHIRGEEVEEEEGGGELERRSQIILTIAFL